MLCILRLQPAASQALLDCAQLRDLLRVTGTAQGCLAAMRVRAVTLEPADGPAQPIVGTKPLLA